MAQAAGAGALRGVFSGRVNLSGRLALVIGGGLPLLFVIALLIVIGLRAFQPDAAGVTGFTLSNFQVIYTNPFVYQTLLNTFVFAGVTVAVALFFGVITAWLVERTDLPGRGLVFPLMTLGVVIPGFVVAMGWTLLAHQRIGVLNSWLTAILPIDQSPFHVGSLVGMGVIQGLSLTGLMFIMTAASLRAMDPSLEESAQIHGLRLITRLRKVTLPLAWPGILAAAIYVFTIGFAAFDIPAIIGMGNRIFVFSSFLYTQVSPDDASPPQYGIAASASALMIGLALVLSLWYLRVIRRSNRFAVVTGKNYRPKLFHLRKRAVAGAWGFISFEFLLIVVLPMLVLLWASLRPFYTVPTMETITDLNLDAYRGLTWRAIGEPVLNTIILVLAVPTVTVIASLLISWVVTRARIRGISPSYDVLAFVPHAVPNIIFAVAAVLFALFFLPQWFPFYGTLYIMIAVYVIIRLGFATRVYNAALVQVHQELDEAGYVFGLSRVTVLWKILRPLLTPAIFYTWIWMALLAYREFTVAALLVTRGNSVLSIQAWQLWEQDFPRGAALTVLMTLGMMPLVILYFVIARRRMGGI